MFHETDTFIQDCLMNTKLNRKAFEIEIFCNIIKVFTVSFAQVKPFLLNKSITFFKRKTFTHPNILNGSVFISVPIDINLKHLLRNYLNQPATCLVTNAFYFKMTLTLKLSFQFLSHLKI